MISSKKWNKEELLYLIKKLNNWTNKSTYTITKGELDYTAIKKFGVIKLREFFDKYYSKILIEYMESDDE